MTRHKPERALALGPGSSRSQDGRPAELESGLRSGLLRERSGAVFFLHSCYSTFHHNVLCLVAQQLDLRSDRGSWERRAKPRPGTRKGSNPPPCFVGIFTLNLAQGNSSIIYKLIASLWRLLRILSTSSKITSSQ